MSNERDRLAKALLEAMDKDFNLIRAGFAQVNGDIYHAALARVERAYEKWKNSE